MATPVLDELLAIEHEGWRALCDGTGHTFYGALMTTDGVMVLAHGQSLGRDAVMASLADAPAWQTYEITQAQLIPLTADAAALTYRATAGRGPSEPAFTALMTSTYVRRGTQWALACYQQTPVPTQDTSG